MCLLERLLANIQRDVLSANHRADIPIHAHMYTVIRQVFQELRLRAPDLPPRRMLDFGAGPGTATWAAAEVRTLQQAGPCLHCSVFA